MQAVVLAAGLGRRLGNLTRSSTKCMVELNGRRLIEYTLDALVDAHVDRVVLVVGHGADEVREFVGTSYGGTAVHYVTNPLYAETNNIYSVLLAREYLEADDTLLLESDVVFDPTIIADCLKAEDPNVAVVAKYERWMDGTVTVLDVRGRIARFVSRDEFDEAESGRYFKTVNIYKLSRTFCRDRFVPFLTTYIGLQGRSHYYEDVLKVLAFMGTEQLVALPVGDKHWYEIDDILDLDIAAALFSDEERRPDRIQQRFGGYWRFERLKDFSHPVNPFFPPARLFEAMSHALPELVTRYPSGMQIQRLLAARLLGCATERVVLGNGASELLRVLLRETPGLLGVPVPTYDEYLQTGPGVEVVELPARGPDFRHNVDDLVQASRERSLSALVLANPAIPSGQFMSRDVVAALLDELQGLGVLLILDESFIDFVDGSSEHTLLRDEYLDGYRNLVIVRSLGKTYGVPGLRLGVLASSNIDMVAAVVERLPVWNINSVGEWFLQAVGEYETDYVQACKQVAIARERLLKGLREIPFLRPLDSHANFLLCEVQGDWTPWELSHRLLNDYWILIKDCTGKQGFQEGAYVRFAVRDTADNDQLLECLWALARSGARVLPQQQ